MCKLGGDVAWGGNWFFLTEVEAPPIELARYASHEFKEGASSDDIAEAAGLDISENMLAQARARFAGAPRVDFLTLDYAHEDLPGGFDLVVGPRRCIVALTHLDKDGNSKVVKKLKYPITGAPQHVDLIITDLAVLEVKGPKRQKQGLVLKEIAPGWTVDELKVVTDANFEVSPELKVYEL